MGLEGHDEEPKIEIEAVTRSLLMQKQYAHRISLYINETVFFFYLLLLLS